MFRATQATSPSIAATLIWSPGRPMTSIMAGPGPVGQEGGASAAGPFPEGRSRGYDVGPGLRLK